MALAFTTISALPPLPTVKLTWAVSLPSSGQDVADGADQQEAVSLYWLLVTVAVVLRFSSSTLLLAESGTTVARAEPGSEVCPRRRWR